MKSLSFTVALLLLATSCVVFAQDAPPQAPAFAVPAGPRIAPSVLPTLMRLLQPRMVQMLSVQIGLSDEQKTKVTDLLTKAEKDLAPLAEAQAKAVEELAAVIIKADSTQAQINAAADIAQKAETAVMAERTKTLLELRAMLTPEQNTKLSDLLTKYTNYLRPQVPPAR